MLIYNTTFNVHQSITDDFIQWIKSQYIPKATQSGHLSFPQLALVMARGEGDDALNYSLQFHVQSVDHLEQWYKQVGSLLVAELGDKFGQKVAGFSTILDKIQL